MKSFKGVKAKCSCLNKLIILHFYKDNYLIVSRLSIVLLSHQDRIEVEKYWNTYFVSFVYDELLLRTF